MPGLFPGSAWIEPARILLCIRPTLCKDHSSSLITTDSHEGNAPSGQYLQGIKGNTVVAAGCRRRVAVVVERHDAVGKILHISVQNYVRLVDLKKMEMKNY